MLNRGLGKHLTINGYVKDKLQQLEGQTLHFGVLFELMFSEKDNTLFEYTENNRIRCITYGECRESILRRIPTLRNRLQAYGPGTSIGLCLPNGRDWIELFWALLLCGYCPLLMNLRLDADTLGDTAARCGVKAVIAGNKHPEWPVMFLSPDEITAAAAGAVPTEPGEAVYLMSSGTSERVKVCAYTAADFAAVLKNSYEIVRKCPQIKRHVHGKLKLLTFLPFYHIFGLVAVYFWFAFFARTLVLLDDMTPEKILSTIRLHQVTHVFAVPMFWNLVYRQTIQAIPARGDQVLSRFEKGMRIAESLEKHPVLHHLFGRAAFREIRDNLFGGSIRFCISGGSEIRPEVLRFMNAIGYHLANGYGMTEIGITSVELSGEPAVLNGGFIGKPLPSVQYRIDEQGQLLVSGQGMACRILNGDRWMTRDEGWFATGDLAQEKNGHYLILGRMDDLVVSLSGENLNPTIVEQRLETGEISELCLIGEKTERGTVPLLIASVGDKKREETEALREMLFRKLKEAGLDRQISRILYVREPLTEPGEIKVNRRKVARRLKEGRFTALNPDDRTDETSQVKSFLRERFAEALGKRPEEIGDESDFFTDYGAGSLEYLSMMIKVQDRYNLPFPTEAGEILTTVSQIAEFIEAGTENQT